MVRLPHEDIPATREPESYTFVKDVTRQVRDAACSLRSKYPKAFEPGTIGGWGNEWARAMWDDVCRKSPVDPPPEKTQPFGGGQCACSAYTVYVRFTFTNSPDQTGFLGLTGKIRGADMSGRDNLGRRLYTIKHQSCATGTPVNVESYLGTVPSNAVGFFITSVVRAGGLPDNCGNPPPDYPSPFNELPPSPYPPVPYDPPDSTSPGQDWDITVPFAYLSPEFNLNVDVGGVNFNIDVGGIEFNLDNAGGENSPGSIGKLPPDITDTLDGIGDKLDEIGDKLDDVGDKVDNPPGDRPPPPDDDDNLDKEEKDEEDPKDEETGDRLRWVKITLTKLPDKVQYGDGAPNCYFAGWLEFRTASGYFPRQQINFQESFFPAPDGATGYAYTLTNGAEGKATVYKEKVGG